MNMLLQLQYSTSGTRPLVENSQVVCSRLIEQPLLTLPTPTQSHDYHQYDTYLPREHTS